MRRALSTGSGAGRAARALGAFLLACIVASHGARAQEPAGPLPAERVRAVADALAALADNAELGAWQAADDAFNRALDAIDAHRAPLEDALGDPAREAFAAIVAGLPELDAALGVEDAPAIRALVVRLTEQLTTLSPDAGGPAQAPAVPAAGVALAWRDALATIRRIEAAEAWRDMRNAAIDMLDQLARQGPILARDGGPEVAVELDRLRVFALRLRAAALDQSHEEGARAAQLFEEALDRLLAAQGILPAPTATAQADGGARFRAFEVVAALGARVSVPIVVEGLPDVGLGGFRLRAQWSPDSLVLVDAALEDGSGEIARDDASGLVELALPQAPIGPTGAAVVATLTFDALDARAEPEAYLPALELAALRDVAREARAHVRLGDVPKAGSLLSAEYARYVGGRAQAGALYAVLASRGGQPDGIADALLRALDLVSQPGETDAIVEALGAIDGAVDVAVQHHFDALGGSDGVPIALDVLSANDTTGAALVLRPSVAGRVLVGSDLPPTLEPSPTARGTVGIEPTPIAALAGPTAGPPPAVRLAPAPRGGAPPAMPRALIAALAVASAVGLIAAWVALRRPEGEPDGQPPAEAQG